MQAFDLGNLVRAHIRSDGIGSLPRLIQLSLDALQLWYRGSQG